MSNKTRCITILALTVFAYFVLFPEDAQAVTTPISTILNLTNAVSPWFYGVVAVGIVSVAIFKTWGGRAGT